MNFKNSMHDNRRWYVQKVIDRLFFSEGARTCLMRNELQANDARFGSLADITPSNRDVCSTPESGPRITIAS
jgi:hypothetical protein